MQPTFGKIPDRAPVRRQEMMKPIAASPNVKEIPYDYVAKFVLNGNLPGNRVQDVINISTDGAFVAVAIGYSFIPGKLPTVTGDVANIPGDLIQLLAERLFVHLCGIDFKYSIIDSSTGRELQNLPLHNVAGLGEPNGNRPFRPMAKSMLFQPRSTIRIEIEEISKGPQYVEAQLYMVLHGYKMLGSGLG
jgi:hypothetical protein